VPDVLEAPDELEFAELELAGVDAPPAGAWAGAVCAKATVAAANAAMIKVLFMIVLPRVLCARYIHVEAPRRETR
jgi:hypothetical protein